MASPKQPRTRIMNISLDLPVGTWRDITTTELKKINHLIGDSSKTYDK
jgi:23S rRNA pseudouridine2604 synthase